jgi:hypothetical protein
MKPKYYKHKVNNISVRFRQKPRLQCDGQYRVWKEEIAVKFEILSQNLQGVSAKNLPGNPSSRRELPYTRNIISNHFTATLDAAIKVNTDGVKLLVKQQRMLLFCHKEQQTTQ